MKLELFIAAPILMASIALRVWGQAPGADPLFLQAPTLDPGLSSLVGNLGIMGVLVWHLWYHTTHSYPRMIEKFAEEAERQRKANETAQKLQREHDATERAREREDDAREKHELRTMLFETMKSMRTAVHDIRDASQQALNKATMAVEKSQGDHKKDTQ